MSELWAKDMDPTIGHVYEQVAEFFITRQMGEGEANDPNTRNQSLSLMRNHLLERMNAVVAVGGATYAEGRFAPGVREELELACKRNLPVFLIGGLGGEAAELAQTQLQKYTEGTVWMRDKTVN